MIKTSIEKALNIFTETSIWSLFGPMYGVRTRLRPYVKHFFDSTNLVNRRWVGGPFSLLLGGVTVIPRRHLKILVSVVSSDCQIALKRRKRPRILKDLSFSNILKRKKFFWHFVLKCTGRLQMLPERGASVEAPISKSKFEPITGSGNKGWVFAPIISSSNLMCLLINQR